MTNDEADAAKGVGRFVIPVYAARQRPRLTLFYPDP